MIVLWIALAAILAAALYVGARGAWEITHRHHLKECSTPSALGLGFQDVVFHASDGVPLRGWLISAPGASKAVVFAHGFAESMDPDLRYVPAFHAAGYTVLMFDFRGHGRSGGRLTTMGWLERRDLLAAARFLQQHGYERIGVIGFSMGAAVAIMTAPLEPAIRAVVADGFYARLTWIIAAGARERRVPGPLAWLVMALSLSLASLWAGCWLPRAAPLDWVGRIAPAALLLIHGGADPYTSVGDARALFEAARDPKELWIEDSAGHRQVSVVRPDEYVARVLAFFDRHL